MPSSQRHSGAQRKVRASSSAVLHVGCHDLSTNQHRVRSNSFNPHSSQPPLLADSQWRPNEKAGTSRASNIINLGIGVLVTAWVDTNRIDFHNYVGRSGVIVLPQAPKSRIGLC